MYWKETRALTECWVKGAWDDMRAVIDVHSTGYSGADMANVCREAAYGPVREAAKTIQHISADEVSCYCCLPRISLYITVCTDKN